MEHVKKTGLIAIGLWTPLPPVVRMKLSEDWPTQICLFSSIPFYGFRNALESTLLCIMSAVGKLQTAKDYFNSGLICSHYFALFIGAVF